MEKSIKNLLIVAVVLFIVSGIVSLIGALAKLQHWYFGGILLNIGIPINALSYLIGGVGIIKYLKSK